jgi:hypothetical protein
VAGQLVHKASENAAVAGSTSLYPYCGRTPRGYNLAAAPAAATSTGEPSRGWAVAMLTYISIGFWANLIYTDDSFGVDHNMLLTEGWDVSEPPIRESVSEMARIRDNIRTLATNSCHIRGCRSRSGELQVRVSEKGMRDRKAHAGI